MNDELTIEQKKIDAGLRSEAMRLANAQLENAPAETLVAYAKKVYKFLKES